MSEEVDTKLADFTEQLLSGVKPEELSWAPEGDDLHSFQKLVVNLYEHGSPQSTKSLEGRILSTLKKDWGAARPKKRQVWKSSRKRKSAFAYAFAFAVIFAAVIIFPFLPSGESGLPAAAESGSIIPILMAIGGLAMIAFLIYGRGGNGEN